MRRSKKIELSEEEVKILTRWSQGRRIEARQTERAKIILLCASGMQTIDVAEKLEISRQKVARWRDRFVKLRIAGIQKDAPRGGRKPKLTKEMTERIIKVTTTEKPQGATHWSTRTLAKHLGVPPLFCQKGMARTKFEAAFGQDV